MLKLKLEYFGHLMRRTDSFEKTLMLGKIEGRRRRGQQRMMVVSTWVTVLFRFSVSFSSVQSLSSIQLFVTPWTAAHQASLSITNSRSSPKLLSIELVMPSSHLISVVPFSSCPQPLPASESFPMSQLFT